MNPGLIPTSRLARSVLRTQSDERLTDLARNGSDAAFEAIVSRYRRSLLRRCARVVGDSDAEEAVQDALLRAHAALARGDEVRNVKAWLHMIAHNAALNILRARNSRPESPHDAAELPHRFDDGPAQREALQEVLHAVSELPDRQRDAIVMRELEGRSYDEIAAQLGTTHGAVRQLLNRARASMRDRVGAITGLEPLLRYALDGGNRAAVARVGALSGGCVLTAKLCTAALIPAVIVGAGGSVAGGSVAGAGLGESAARARTATARTTKRVASTTRHVPRHATTTAARVATRTPRVFVVARPTTPTKAPATHGLWRSAAPTEVQIAKVRQDCPPAQRDQPREPGPSRQGPPRPNSVGAPTP